MSNDSQVVVITGAAMGIGRSIATRFRRNGAKLVLLDVHNEQLKEVAKELGPDVLPIECNVSRKSEVESARDQALEIFGRIDVLVNNAGILDTLIPLEDLTEEMWQKPLDVNLNGTFLCTQAFGVPMLDRGGSIINVSSISGTVPTPLRSAYSVSKAAVLMLTQQTALEWGFRKVRANAVCPGLIVTPMTADMYKTAEDQQRRAELVPLGRVGLPEDIANAVFFLASRESEYMNGEFLRVDGGFTLTPMLRAYSSQIGRAR